MTVLKTKRLTLRPMRPDDAADLFEVFGNADAMRYWSTLPHATVEDTKEMIARTIGADPAQHLELCMDFDGKVIGKIGLWSMPEVGYILHPDYWRRGFAGEALAAVIDHGFNSLALPQITADVDPDNAASRAMLGKFGFVETGHEQNTLKIGVTWFDSVYLALDAANWPPDNSV